MTRKSKALFITLCLFSAALCAGPLQPPIGFCILSTVRVHMFVFTENVFVPCMDNSWNYDTLDEQENTFNISIESFFFFIFYKIWISILSRQLFPNKTSTQTQRHFLLQISS